MRYGIRLALTMVLFILLSGCAKKTMVVLVPDPDGKTGRISVANQAGSVAIEAPNQATFMTDRGKLPSPPAPVEKETIADLFSEALSIQPNRPAHFLLYFEKDTVLTANSFKLMTGIIAAIQEQASTDISVIGHTDTLGSKDYNLSLSRDRALFIRDLLVKKGVDAAYIRTTSHGKENPLIKTDDNVSEPRNRRVEVIIR
jgi:outer membrane protein OmpA-like peptidoglycan-associated protein